MEQNLNLMTWNVDWFRNGQRAGEDCEYFEEDSSEKIYECIVAEVKAFLEKESSVVFLQEVPYKAKGERWHSHYLFKRLHKDFSNRTYELFMNDDFSYRSTVAIARKGTFKKVSSYYPCNNRTVAVEYGDIILLGVHMPTHFSQNDGDDKMWEDLIRFVKTSSKKIIIAGDFNAFIGCTQKLTEEKYIRLLGYVGNCVSESIVTYGRTSIDKFLLSKTIGFNNITYAIMPQQQKLFSDHKYICMKVTIHE